MVAASDSAQKGSSPHTRGARIEDMKDITPSRIIPAYAGSTRIVGFGQIADGDHPRIRGEHYSVSRFVNAVMGSSPHTRGAPSNAQILNAVRGIIPAYAGSTIRWQSSCQKLRGSSPHTRGALLCVQLPSESRGIIPAYAGSTSARGPSFGVEWDHPRIRGEHCWMVGG